ncbi:MAG: putative glycolipid-binding domain-containing protein [Thermodesulfobacteriota bacterium]
MERGEQEYLTLGERGGNVYAESLIISDGGGRPFAARYAIECDPDWRVRSVGAHLIGEPRETRLLSDGEGGWTDGSVELPDLKALSTSIFFRPRLPTRFRSGGSASARANRRILQPPILPSPKCP